MAATLTQAQRNDIWRLAQPEAEKNGLFFYEQNGTDEHLEALESLGLITFRSATHYFAFSNGELGEEDGFLVNITEKGRKSYELAAAAGLHSAST